MADRGVSPDSSTHISEKSRKSKKRKHKQKSKTKHKKVKSSSSESNHTHTHKKSKKHKRSSHSPANSDESDEEIIDIKPLAGYIDDKKKLHKEIFSLVSKKEVKDLLPSSLKKLKFKEFKSLCLEQLVVMSQKRIRHVIAGQEMVSSSSDESEAQEHQPQDANDGENESVKMDTSANKTSKQLDAAAIENTEEQPPKVSILEEMSLLPNQDEIDELIEPEPQTSQQPVQLELEEQDMAGEEKGSPTQEDDQSLLMAEADLRELEFRARALKSLVIARERQQKLEKEKQDQEAT
ncbi:caspase activity and apoptosis inhibitor 1-like [Actinia tenebrosa]|uniref:Caspase activity and apoptosis inhibitor 1-like n=1 Tax=Actinia tenebrosa TaxID=6105 RepID=A0A6P8IAT5_ACTTE|nr:caspase activity and apoptosis inhibitor 1-like [Actinia tenebrosa]